MPAGSGVSPVPAPVVAEAAPAVADVRPAGVVGVCTGDAALLATLRDAAPDLTIAGVDTPQELADLMVARGCFAVFLDVRTMPGALATLLPALARQFPALPVVAVGTRSEEADVARLIGSGEVYRFLHVPVSLERARTFLGAARRRADELQQRHSATVAAAARDEGDDDEDDDADDHASNAAGAAPSTRAAPPPATRAPAALPADAARGAPPGSNFRATLFALTALGLVVAAGTTWLSRPEPRAEPASSGDPVVADLVGAASAAATAGALLAPAGQSAADYYRRALARRPDDTEARASLLALSDRMLSAGERALAGGRWEEAEAAASTVALVRPRDPRVFALLARADEARAAAEAAQIEPEAGASLPPSPANTDERAGFEEARDAPAVPDAPRAASTASSTSAAGGAPPSSAAPELGVAPTASTAPTVSTTPVASTTPAATPGQPLPASAPYPASPAPDGAVAASPSPATRAAPASAADVRTGGPGTLAASPSTTSIDGEPRTSAVASTPPSSRPVPLRRIADAAPVYPTRARARGIEGWVDVAFTVDATGRVTGARVLSAEPSGAFDEAALEAVRRWRYAPPPVPQDANVRLRFRLDR